MTISLERIRIRDASKGDCGALAELIDIAGEGLAAYVWAQLAGPGEDPREVGRQRAARETGSFSYRNSVVAEADGRIAGALVGYPIAVEPAPIDTATTPAMFVPLQELENLAAGTWYVNAIATFPETRGQGVGSKLMRYAEQRAAELGLRGLSLIVSDANQGARALYERLGYSEVARRPMVREQWETAGQNWVLMMYIPGN